MKHAPWIAVAALLFLSCGGGDDGAGPGGGNNTPLVPVPTSPGSPNGASTTQTIGAGGGLVTSSDAAFTLDIPAGALSTDTDITVQPITSTAWGALGGGYRLTPAGLAFAVPVGLEFQLSDSLLAGTDTSSVDVAVQDDNGLWHVLKNRVVDAAGTITCTTTHFSDYELITGLAVVPGSAIIAAGSSLPMEVQYCPRAAYTGNDPNLAYTVVGTCDPTPAAPATFTNWAASAGGVSPTSGRATTYHAPSTAVNPITAIVTVDATAGQEHATLRAYVTILGSGGGGTEKWVGTSTVVLNGSDIAKATVTWVQVGELGSIRAFKPTGFVEYSIPDTGDCTFVSLTPDTWLIGDTDGTLLIDYGVDPPTFEGGASTQWSAEFCETCPDIGTECNTIPMGAAWFADQGVVINNGTRIEGILVDDNGDPFMTYTFDKQP